MAIPAIKRVHTDHVSRGASALPASDVELGFVVGDTLVLPSFSCFSFRFAPAVA